MVYSTAEYRKICASVRRSCTIWSHHGVDRRHALPCLSFNFVDQRIEYSLIQRAPGSPGSMQVADY